MSIKNKLAIRTCLYFQLPVVIKLSDAFLTASCEKEFAFLDLNAQFAHSQ